MSNLDLLTRDHDVASHVDSFQRDGFVHVPGLLDPAEIDAFRAEIDDAVAWRKRNDKRAWDEKSPYEQMFHQCINLWVDFPAVRRLDFHPVVAEFAAKLLGADRVRLWHDQALYKEPGGGETEAHQDYAYWPVAEPDMLTAWVPLVDVDQARGCMGYVPGTQGVEREFVDIFATPGAGRAFAARHDAPTFIPARKGDVIFHHCRLVHMAGANLSKETRSVHTVVYFRDGCTRMDDRVVSWGEAAVGAPFDGPSTPIAWPLPGDGVFPNPPEITGGLSQRFRDLGVIPDLPRDS